MNNLTPEAKFLSIPLESVKEGRPLKFDIYISQDGKQILYRSKNLPFEESHRHKIEKLAGRLFIRRDDNIGYFEYVRETLKTVMESKTTAPREKLRIFYEESKGLMQNLVDSPEEHRLRQEGELVLETSLSAINDISKGIEDFLDLMSFEYLVYSHSLNVSILSTCFAKYLGLPVDVSRKVGLGGLFHDLGKSKIPREILLKPGGLTPDEWNVMKTHSELGYDIVRNQGDIPEDIQQIVRLHHEKYCGGGYPLGLSGEDIPLAVQIVTHADIFDALTTERCYKSAVNTFVALTIMKTEMTKMFREDLLVAFIKMFQKK